MKKISIFLIIVFLLITGCGKQNKNNIIDDFKNQIDKSKSYELTGTMEIINDEDVFKYDINAKYLNDDIEYYKVILVNQTNNHEQIILKNTEGVYVITPSLNKSFKFQSNWPNNSSQSYLLSSIVTDMKNDKDSTFEEKDGKYIIKNKVNYPNNEELVYEKVYLNKNKLPDKVEVFNNKDNVKIRVNFSKIDLKANIDEDEFDLSKLIKEPECDDKCKQNKEKNESEKTKTTEDSNTNNSNEQLDTNEQSNTSEQSNDNQPSDTDNNSDKQENKPTTSIKDIIYPLYVPANTSLKSKDVVSTDTGERVILTFAGDNSFVLVEETSSISPEFEIIPVYGDPEMINDSVGALSANSLSWTSNNVNYYLTGSTLGKNDLINIATSLNNVGAVNAEK